MTDFGLTPLEVLCGVTIEQAREVAARGLILHDGQQVVLEDKGPALCGAAARCALGHPAYFLGFNDLGLAVYQKQVS